MNEAIFCALHRHIKMLKEGVDSWMLWAALYPEDEDIAYMWAARYEDRLVRVLDIMYHAYGSAR